MRFLHKIINKSLFYINHKCKGQHEDLLGSESIQKFLKETGVYQQ